MHMASARDFCGNFFVVLFTFASVSILATGSIETPRFTKPISNITIPVGREAILECVVEHLGTYKVAWLRVDTQTILTIASHVITKNHRIMVTHIELKTWYLHIRDVQQSDRGWYMCQINTDPMKSQVGYMDVVGPVILTNREVTVSKSALASIIRAMLTPATEKGAPYFHIHLTLTSFKNTAAVPPDILDYPTSADMVVDENSDVSLRCATTGSPEPTVTWKREDGQPIRISNGSEVSNITGEILNLTKVKREHMGTYLCIASNGVPPSVSKRISLLIQFPPSVWIQYQLIGAYDGQKITLECHSQAFPKSINYWARDNGDIIPHSTKYVPEIIGDNYKVHMKLTINFLGSQDFGIYKCVSKNSLGDMEGSVNVYKIPHPNIAVPTKDKSAAHDKTDDLSERIENNQKDKVEKLLKDKTYFGSGSNRFQTIDFKKLIGMVCFSVFVIRSFIAFGQEINLNY